MDNDHIGGAAEEIMEKTAPISTGAPGNEALSKDARASKLIGAQVYASDAEVGAIQDLMIDREHNKVDAAIVSVGGFLGLGERFVAIPMSRMTIGDWGRLTIDMTTEELKSAANFDYVNLN